jgi:hypothetical protein
MRIFKKYFTVWWIPIIFYIIPIFGFQYGISKKSNDIIDYSLDIFLINIGGNIISSIVLIIRKKWYFILPQIIVSAILFFFVSIFFSFGRPDYYGADKEIPKNSNCEKPVYNGEKEIKLNSNDFNIRGGYGHYEYDVNFHLKEKGYLYIKAYEITSNDRISESYLNDEYAQIKVEDFTKKIYRGRFSIYQGNMGYQYCARMELWFKPNGKKEYKLKEKNYIIEGDSG